MSQVNENRVLKLGEGFRADCDRLRLFVEVVAEGWTVAVYDMNANTWLEKKRVNSAEEGEARATWIAAAALEEADLQPKWTTL